MMTRQMVICTIDHTDNNLHNDQIYFDIEIYIWEHLELELKSKLKSELKVGIKIIQYVKIQ